MTPTLRPYQLEAEQAIYAEWQRTSSGYDAA